MKIILTVTFIFFLLTYSIFCKGQNDTIYWSSLYKLKWEDFKGIPDSTSQFGAISRPGIKYSLSANEDNFSTKVTCFFIKSKSWVRVYSKIGLIHEQGHFDIAELFARKLRKVFAEYRLNYQSVSKDIDNLFLTNKSERNKMDTLYDKQTDFSRNRQQQQVWNKKLAAELEKLKEYSIK